MPAVKRVVDRRVAEGTRDADARELIRLADLALDPDDSVEPQELDGHGGVAQIDLPCPQRRDDLRRQRLDVDLESNRERGGRGNRRDDFVHPQHVGPQLLVAEGVVAKDGSPIPMTAFADLSSAAGRLGGGGLAARTRRGPGPRTTAPERNRSKLHRWVAWPLLLLPVLRFVGTSSAMTRDIRQRKQRASLDSALLGHRPDRLVSF